LAADWAFKPVDHLFGAPDDPSMPKLLFAFFAFFADQFLELRLSLYSLVVRGQ